MFSLSWRLTIVTFCILPATVILSNVYGEWIQMLATRAQTRMAECNKKAQNCLSSIATVRSFAAEQSEADACVECGNAVIASAWSCLWFSCFRYCVALSEFYLESMREAKGYGMFVRVLRARSAPAFL